MSTEIELAAFAYLTPTDGSRASCSLEKISDPVAEFLEEHVADLLRKAQADTAPPAKFEGSNASVFDELASADRKAFLAAADRAAKALQGEMDERMKPGLFVALKRRGDDGGPTVVVLKLDVVEPHAGRLAREGDRMVLAIVQDLVDSPGNLQKGAASPDPRATSEVIAGEREIGEASQYFLRALGIRQMAHPRIGARRLIRTLRKIEDDDRKVEEVASRLEDSKAGSLQGFLGEVRDVLPKSRRDELSVALTEVPHPVGPISPEAAHVTRMLEGDGITISGRVHDMRRVELAELPGGEWRAEITFKKKPQERYG